MAALIEEEREASKSRANSEKGVGLVRKAASTPQLLPRTIMGTAKMARISAEAAVSTLGS